MRKSGEYVAAAVAGLRAGAMSDCAATLRHGDHVASVVRVGSPARGEDAVTDYGPAEAVRCLAVRGELPLVAKGSAVTLDGSLRVVTSARTDPAGASLVVGLSDAFERAAATYRGTRRDGGSVRRFETSFDVLFLDAGDAPDYSDALAPGGCKSFLVAVRREDWTDATEPVASDTLELEAAGLSEQLKVSAVERADGWYVLKCRTKR